MKKYILDLINHEIKITEGLINSCEKSIEQGRLESHANKRIKVLKNKLTKITKYKEQLEKLL